jgi:putative peptidoglycan lipid II flippase
LLLVGFSSIIIPLLVPGFGGDVVSLAVKLGVILSWIMVMGGASATLQSILLSHHRYGLVSSTKLVSSCVAILALVLLHDDLGVYALANGILLGTGCAFGMTLYAAHRLGFRYMLICNLNDWQVRQMFRSLLYPLGGHALGECKTLVENGLLSFLASGSLSALRYASKIVEALVGVTLGSIATSTLPLVSHYAAEKNFELMKGSVLKGIKFLLFVAGPMSIWLIYCGDSLVMVLFGRGQFTIEDAGLTGALIAMMTPYIVMSRMSVVMQSMFYATNDTRTPAISAVVNFFVNIIVAIGSIKTIGIYAFPVASSVGAACTAGTMSLLLHKRFGPLGWKKLKVFAARFSASLAMTTLAFMVSLRIRGNLSTHVFSDQVTAFVVPSVIGGIVFCASSLLLGIVNRHRWQGLFGPRKAV